MYETFDLQPLTQMATADPFGLKRCLTFGLFNQFRWSS